MIWQMERLTNAPEKTSLLRVEFFDRACEPRAKRHRESLFTALFSSPPKEAGGSKSKVF
jgi:hypothetical protein